MNILEKALMINILENDLGYIIAAIFICFDGKKGFLKRQSKKLEKKRKKKYRAKKKRKK